MSLSAHALCKSYAANAPVLHNVSLDVEDGELVGITGPSGSGKSTLIHCIAGIEMLDSGTISVDGIPVEDCKPHLRSIGVVMQDQPLYGHMSVEENIGFPLRARGVIRSEISQRVSAALESLQLSKIAGRRASQLSGGEQRRVAIGRAIIIRPRILLLDEPLVSLDQELRDSITQLVRQVHDQIGAATLFVTHDQLEAKTLCDRVVAMESLCSNST